MNIDLTPEEYRDLLDLIYIADWVTIGHKEEDEEEEPDPRTKRYEELKQLLFSYADEFELENLIEHDLKKGRYLPTAELQEGPARAYIEQYEKDAFWEELVLHLARRDLARELGGYDQLAALPEDERADRLWPLEEKYDAELVQNGIENFELNTGGEED